MDPNTNIKAQRDAALHILNHGDTPDQDLGRHLAELVMALDEWIIKEGFLPSQWLNAHEAHTRVTIENAQATNRQLRKELNHARETLEETRETLEKTRARKDGRETMTYRQLRANHYEEKRRWHITNDELREQLESANAATRAKDEALNNYRSQLAITQDELTRVRSIYHAHYHFALEREAANLDRAKDLHQLTEDQGREIDILRHQRDQAEDWLTDALTIIRLWEATERVNNDPEPTPLHTKAEKNLASARRAIEAKGGRNQ